MRELAYIAHHDMGAAFDLADKGWRFLPPRDLPYEIRKAIKGIKLKRRVVDGGEDGDTYTVEDIDYDFADKTAALDKLMRYFGGYKDGDVSKLIGKLKIICEEEEAGDE